jgi:hypothetical protein
MQLCSRINPIFDLDSFLGGKMEIQRAASLRINLKYCPPHLPFINSKHENKYWKMLEKDLAFLQLHKAIRPQPHGRKQRY